MKEKEFDFENPAVFLFGDNRSGKSSTLNAVEWCLFGNDCIGGETGIRERINFEIPNRKMKPLNTLVELILEDKGSSETYKIFRKWISAKRHELILTLPNGTSLAGQDAENKLAQIIKSTFRDFLTTVYQHQEAIRDVVTQEPGERNDAIDRLLGLSVYRNLLTGLDKANLKSQLKGMGKVFDSFKDEVERA
ncbi:MAG TPA: ATP-binding protein, partial [Thermodesulfobacteriota bacterium]